MRLIFVLSFVGGLALAAPPPQHYSSHPPRRRGGGPSFFGGGHHHHNNNHGPPPPPQRPTYQQYLPSSLSSLYGKPKHQPQATSYPYFSGGHSSHGQQLGHQGQAVQYQQQLQQSYGHPSLQQSSVGQYNSPSFAAVSPVPIIPEQLPFISQDGVAGLGGGGGSSQISKSVYIFSAPIDPSENVRPQIVKKFPQERQKHYQVVFINAPNPPLPPQHTVELPPPPELRTQIYVLVKKPQAAPPVKIIPAKVPVHKPEVFFIRYKNKNGEGGYTAIPSDGSVPYGAPEDLQIHTHQEHVAPQEGYAQPDNHHHSHHHQQPTAEEYIPTKDYSPQEQQQLLQQYGITGEENQGQGATEYVTQSGAFGYNNEGVDPYSDYSRLNAHYASTIVDPSAVSINRTWRTKKVKKDKDNSTKWTPILPRERKVLE